MAHPDELIAWMERTGLTAPAAGKRLGVPAALVAAWMAGKRDIPDLVMSTVRADAIPAPEVVKRLPKADRLAIAKAIVPSLKTAREVEAAAMSASDPEPWVVQRYWGVPDSPHHSGVPVPREAYTASFPGYRLMWEGDRAWKEPIGPVHAKPMALPEGMEPTSAAHFAKHYARKAPKTGKPLEKLIGPYDGRPLKPGQRVVRICRQTTESKGQPWARVKEKAGKGAEG